MTKLRPGEIGLFARGAGAAGLIQEVSQHFLSLLHLFFLVSPSIKVKVLKFCRSSLMVVLSKTGDPRPRLCAL